MGAKVDVKISHSENRNKTILSGFQMKIRIELNIGTE